MEKLRAGVFSFLLAGLLSAQATHVVGPGGFLDIDSALAAAAPGDILLVQPGTYPTFHATTGVTIRAAAAGVVVNGFVSSVAVPAPQRMHFVGMRLARVSVTGSTATFDRCRIEPPGTGFSGGTALTVTDSHVHLQDCELIATSLHHAMAGSALNAVDSTVTAIDCVCRGSDTVPSIGQSYAGHAVVLSNSLFAGSGLDVRGGNGAEIAWIPALALVDVGNSTVWVSDSDVRGGIGSNGLMPCPPVALLSGRFVRTTLTPAGPCGGVPPVTTGPMLGLHRPMPLQSPGPFTLEFQSDPLTLVGVFFSGDLGQASGSGLEQPVWLDAMNLNPLAVLVTDAAGQASASWSIGPGLADATIWFQAVGVPLTGPLQLSPVAGGVVR